VSDDTMAGLRNEVARLKDTRDGLEDELDQVCSELAVVRKDQAILVRRTSKLMSLLRRVGKMDTDQIYAALGEDVPPGE